MHSHPAEPDGALVMTPTTIANMERVEEAASRFVPLLLEGATGVGKSATIAEAARRQVRGCCGLRPCLLGEHACSWALRSVPCPEIHDTRLLQRRCDLDLHGSP